MSFTAPTIPLEIYGEANIRLGRIETEENITILHAVESGSRAWGFPSPDSDNDVRFFYIRPLPRYLGLHEERDVVERPVDGVWDLNGWDLRKALTLLVKGNATVAEWMSSPLIYREHGPLPSRLRDLIKRHSTWQLSARHYYGLTKNTYERDINRGGKVTDPRLVRVKQKAYFYAIRGALAIAWIERYKEIPPMSLPMLLSHSIIEHGVRETISGLQTQKATMGELGTGPRIRILDDFIERQVRWVEGWKGDRFSEDPAFIAAANELLLDAMGVGH